jgi:hypothetical protein
MKRNSRTTLVTATASVASLMIAFCASAGTPAQANASSFQLNASATELPAQAAQLVTAASADQREDTTKSVVLQALAERPMTAPAVVGAIAKSSPDMAPTAAVTAVVQQPTQIGQITKAATAAAPQMASKIAFALCQKFPTQFNLVAMAATEGAPQAGKDILAAIASAVPSVKLYITQSQASTFAGVISDAQSSVEAAAKSANTTPEMVLASASSTPYNSAFPYTTIALPAPTPGPPFQTPGNGTPAYITGSQLTVVTPGGGRNYSGSEGN